MSKKSQASLSIVHAGPIVRHNSPTHLTDEQAAVWAEIVGTKPGDWFAADTYPLLEAYCRAVTEHRKISLLVDRFDPEMILADGGMEAYKDLAKMQDMQAKLIMSLATKMRLSQQSKYGARSAESADRKSAKGGKPWQRATLEHGAS